MREENKNNDFIQHLIIFCVRLCLVSQQRNECTYIVVLSWTCVESLSCKRRNCWMKLFLCTKIVLKGKPKMALLSVKTTSAWNQLSDKKQSEEVPGSMHQIFIGFWDVVVTSKNGASMGFNRMKWLDKSCTHHQREVCDLIGRVSHIDSFF